MEAQTAIAVKAGRNYVQLRVKREPDPFFLRIDEGQSSPVELVGDVVTQDGTVAKPNERIERNRIAKVTRAILAENEAGSPSLIPVKPISPAGKR